MEGQKYLAPLQTTSGTAWQPPAGGVPDALPPRQEAGDEQSANGHASPPGTVESLSSVSGSVESSSVTSNSWQQHRPDLEKVGLLGSNSKVVWVGNIPEGSAQDSNIRLLFAGCGDIRRVYMRRKKSPSMSWCLLMFRASESATVALTSDPPTVVDSDGSTVQLAVEHPNIEKELTKANPGALGQVVGQALTDSLDDAETSPKNKTRRRSAAEIDIRSSVTSDQTVEMVSALGSEQATKRAGWNRIRKASVKKKIAVAAMFVQNDDANEKAAKVAIGAKMKIVTASEPEITNTVRALAELYHGELRGLDYRFKTEASLFRKVMSRLDATLAETALSKEHTPTPTPADILESILDVLRYTAVFQTKDYTTSVRKSLSALAEQGYKELRVKNFWGPGDGYQGINTVFVSPDSQPFELQFHTPESLSMKEEECHSSYEKFRTATDSRKMMQYWEEMVSMWDMVPVPEDVLAIPKVVQQELEFDLSKLSAEEKAAIEHRKALEKVCRYPVDELHARALRAEAEIGALVVYLMHKHGAHGVCEQKDRRSAVRGQLSILRQLVDTFIQEEGRKEQELHEQMLAYLRGVSVFENVNETTLSAIAESLDVKSFKQGETILKKGDPGSTFFLIKDGTVGFSLEDDGKIQKTRTSPEFFGEISLLSDDNRITATAIARTNCECFTLQRDVFDELVRSNLANDSDRGNSALQHSKSKRALIDDSIATKLTVSTKMKPSKVNQSRAFSATSFRSESGSVTSALHGGISMRSASVAPDDMLPDEPTLRDRLRELELEFPPLKYKIVVTNEQLYTMCVHGFLRDIAQDVDYEIYAVNNWWDDLEKFGAINARFLAVRHGLRFEVTLHTTASWDAFTTHSEYMRRRFDTVIKTDVLYGADEDKIQKAKSDMRREEMWRDRWARIHVPDRTLTVGTLRYAHVECPSREELEESALKTVGQSRTALKKFKKTGRKVKLINLLNAGLAPKRAAATSGQPSGGGSAPSPMAASNDDEDDDNMHASEVAGVGGMWDEVVGAWLASDESAQRRFDSFRKQYVEERGLDARMWQPVASRVAGLEAQVRKMQKRGGVMECCCGRRRDPDRRSIPARFSASDDQTSIVRFSAETDFSQLPRDAKVLEP